MNQTKLLSAAAILAVLSTAPTAWSQARNPALYGTPNDVGNRLNGHCVCPADLDVHETTERDDRNDRFNTRTDRTDRHDAYTTTTTTEQADRYNRNRTERVDEPRTASYDSRSGDYRRRSGTVEFATPQKANKASHLVGMSVRNQAGERLGTIKDLVVDLNTGKISYAVLATGLSLTGNAKLHAVPVNAFETSADGDSLILNADKDKLTQAEGFDRNNWPNVNNPTWGAETPWESRPDRDSYKHRSNQSDVNQNYDNNDRRNNQERRRDNVPDQSNTPDQKSQPDQK